MNNMYLKWMFYFTVFIFFSCSNTSIDDYEIKKQSKTKNPINGKVLYLRNCTTCHGINGNEGLSGAKDLSKSKLTDKEILQIIEKGKGGMMPFNTILKSKKERQAVANYIKTLRH